MERTLRKPLSLFTTYWRYVARLLGMANSDRARAAPPTGPLVTPTVSDNEAPFEMANLGPKRTGLDFVVWISNRGGARHDARVKVSPRSNQEPQASFAIRHGCRRESGDDTWMTSGQKDALAKWVDLNRSVLLQFWDSEEWDHQDAMERLKSL